MSEIRLNLADVAHQRAAGELSQLNNILRPTTFEAAIIASIDGFFGRQWLFDAIHQWLQSNRRIFWLQGAPGIGKSAFAAQLVHRGDSAIVGYFKCDFQAMKSAEESATECIRTLAYQLATRLPDYRVKLLRGNKLEQLAVDIKNFQAKQDKTPDDLFRYLITEPLNRMEKIGEANRMALLIDAMDEAGRWVNGKIVNPLADLVYKHADHLPDWLGIIITSRTEAYLQQQLASKFNPIVIAGDNRENIRDLEDYVGTRLPDELTGHQRQQIIQTIIEKSGGTFLYIKRVETSYDLSKPEILPSGLDDLLYRDFERYCPNLQIYEEKTEKFLRLLSAAPGPVPAQLAQELLGWPAREIASYVTQPLASLLNETTEGIRFFHKSMKEWLLDRRRSGFYQVNDDGAELLGNFLWHELRKSTKASEIQLGSKWQKQIQEWLPDLSLMNKVSDISYVIVDVETTGVSLEKGRITRIDAIRITDGLIDYDSLFSEYVNPGQDIPPEIQKITGITNDVVRHAPEIGTVLRRFHEFIDSSILVSHHAVFPKRFLAAAADACQLPRIQLPWLCTLKLSRELFKDKSCSLTSVCQYLGVAIDNDSLDVLVEAECFLKLKELMVNKFDQAASNLA
jgi:DNA polymerase III epsilon subunit-like protein